MRAAVYERYGPPEVVQVRNVDKPVPRPGQILVRVRAATLAAGDWRMRRPTPFLGRLYNGLLRPKRVKILGFELAGVVEAVGPRVDSAVTRFKVGDDVFAFTGFGFGAHAEYRCLPERPRGVAQGQVALKPTTMSYEEAAAVPVGALTAQAFLRDAGVERGQSVLVYGASGSVGTYAVQLARHLGAQVTGVCSGANLDLVRSLGADAAIDYTQQDFAAAGQSYDVVFDAVGKLSAGHGRRALAKGGAFRSVQGYAKFEPDDLERLKALIEAGELKAVIDRGYDLADIAKAHAYAESGRKRGNVVIVVGDSGS